METISSSPLDEAQALLHAPEHTFETLERAWMLTALAGSHGASPDQVRETSGQVWGMLRELLSKMLDRARTAHDSRERRRAYARAKEIAALLALTTNHDGTVAGLCCWIAGYANEERTRAPCS